MYPNKIEIRPKFFKQRRRPMKTKRDEEKWLRQNKVKSDTKSRLNIINWTWRMLKKDNLSGLLIPYLENKFLNVRILL